MGNRSTSTISIYLEILLLVTYFFINPQFQNLIFKKYFLFKKNNNKIFKFKLKNKKIPYYKYQRKFKPSRIIFKQPRRILNNATKLQYKILINSERYKNKYFSVSTKNIYIRNSKN